MFLFWSFRTPSAFDPWGHAEGCSVLNKSHIRSVIKRAPQLVMVGGGGGGGGWEFFHANKTQKADNGARDSCGGGYSKSHCSRTPVNRPRAALHRAGFGASQFNVIFHYNGQWRQKTASQPPPPFAQGFEIQTTRSGGCV